VIGFVRIGENIDWSFHDFRIVFLSQIIESISEQEIVGIGCVDFLVLWKFFDLKNFEICSPVIVNLKSNSNTKSQYQE
jgi:hypothetical protein